jgi:hypothetical protein
MRFAYLTHEDVPKTLYHYTSLEALVSIVQSKRLRASAIQFLNDTSEAVRLKEDVVSILRKRTSSSKDQEILKTLIDALDPGPKQSLFVASLSEKSDLLSQWRAYCPSGRGVSIGFSSDSLGEQWIANPRGDKPFFLGAPLQKVRYYESAHQGELEQMIDRLLETERKHNGGNPSKYPNFNVLAIVAPLFKGAKFEEGELDEVTRIAADKIIELEGNPEPKLHLPGSAIATWVFLLSPFIKHGAFAEECEWRKVVSKDIRTMPGQQFRTGKSTLIPYVEIMLDVMRQDADCVPREDYFINEVIVGPTPTPELTSEALRSLFEAEGHPEVIVRTSRIPFRDW